MLKQFCVVNISACDATSDLSAKMQTFDSVKHLSTNTYMMQLWTYCLFFFIAWT